MSCVSPLALGTYNDWYAVGIWMSEQEDLEPRRDAASLHLLNLEVDNQVEESYFRILDNDKHVRYISIGIGIYNTEDLCFEPILLSILPPFPPGPWNVGYIAKDDRGKPYFASTETKELPGISSTWHSVRVDYLTLHLGKSYRSHIFEASSPDFSSTVIIKFARFAWEVRFYAAETEAYSWLEGHDIAPKFLGHLTEEGRVIGMILEKVEGRHATIDDLESCEAVVRRLHGLGIVHGDLNKHNFLVDDGGNVALIDFESAKKSTDKEAMEKETEGIKEQLLTKAFRGGIATGSSDEHY